MASMKVVQLIVSPLVGDLPLVTLLPSGVTPHSYSPRPSEVVALNRAKVVVLAHHEVDGWIQGMTRLPHVSLFDEEDYVYDPGAGAGMTGHSHSHDHSDFNPHQWSDPEAVRRSVPDLASGLCELFEDHCPAIRRRATVFAGAIQTLTDSLTAAADADKVGSSPRCFITAQPFMDPFLERFGFQVLGPLSPSPEVEPSPASLSRLIKEARESSCTTLVLQDVLENQFERRLAEEQGWRIVTVDPLGNNASSYAEYLWGLYDALTSSHADKDASRIVDPTAP